MIQTKKCLLSHEVILLDFISCDISLLFKDTEIFAAYAGSCLFNYFPLFQIFLLILPILYFFVQYCHPLFSYRETLFNIGIMIGSSNFCFKDFRFYIHLFLLSNFLASIQFSKLSLSNSSTCSFVRSGISKYSLSESLLS